MADANAPAPIAGPIHRFPAPVSSASRKLSDESLADLELFAQLAQRSADGAARLLAHAFLRLVAEVREHRARPPGEPPPR